jgi:hypothetical protein
MPAQGSWIIHVCRDEEDVIRSNRMIIGKQIDNSGGQAGFVVQRAPDSTGTYSQIAQVPLGVVSYTDTAVSPGTTYCYRVAAVNGAGMSAFSEPACGNPSGGFTLTVMKAGTGGGTVTGSSAGINCGTACAYTYPAGKVVTLTATPSSGSTFSGWSGGGCGGTDTCTLVGNVPSTVTATFVVGASNSMAPNQGSPGAEGPMSGAPIAWPVVTFQSRIFPGPHPSAPSVTANSVPSGLNAMLFIQSVVPCKNEPK